LVTRRYLDDRFTPGKQLYLLDPETGEAQPLVVDAAYYHAGARWDPTGERIIFQRYPLHQAGALPSVWTVDLGTGELKQVAENAMLPQWLPVSDEGGSPQPAEVAVYPSPPPVTFVVPTPLPTLPPTATVTEAPVLDEPLPDLTLTTLDGDSIRLADLKGQIVFLNFWATWCAPCQEEMPALQALQDEHGADGVRVIAVTDPTAGQTEADVLSFLKTYNLTLTVALSSDAAFYQHFGVAQIPMTYIIDRAGIVRYRQIGALEPEDIATYLQRLAN
jgi:peroxiredoxin